MQIIKTNYFPVFRRINAAEKPIAVMMDVIVVTMKKQVQQQQQLHQRAIQYVMLATLTWHQSDFLLITDIIIYFNKYF